MADTNTYPASNVKVGAFDASNFVSLNSALFKDDVYPEILKRNGYGELIFDILELSEATYDMKQRSTRVLEMGQMERVVTVGTGGIAVGAAGAAATFTLDTSDQDSAGGIPVQVNDTVIIDGTFQASGEDKEYVITAISGATPPVITLTPLSGAAASVPADIDTAIPAGTKLTIASDKHGYGTGQPDGAYDVIYYRDYEAEITKTTHAVEGGVDALEWWAMPRKSGGNGVMFRGQEILEFKHNKKLDGKLFFSEPNENTANLTATSTFGGTNALPSTKGIWNWATEVGQNFGYSGAWSMADFYDMKDILRAQNVTTNELMFMYGTNLGRQIEESNLDWIREYSGGTDLYKNANSLGVNIKNVEVNGLMFGLKEMKSFANPTRWGNNSLSFADRGLVIPIGAEAVTIDGQSTVKPTIMMGYLKNNGVDRTRKFGYLKGMDQGGDVASDVDASKVFLLSEHATIVHRPNQFIRVKPV